MWNFPFTMLLKAIIITLLLIKKINTHVIINKKKIITLFHQTKRNLWIKFYFQKKKFLNGISTFHDWFEKVKLFFLVLVNRSNLKKIVTDQSLIIDQNWNVHKIQLIFQFQFWILNWEIVILSDWRSICLLTIMVNFFKKSEFGSTCKVNNFYISVFLNLDTHDILYG